MPYLSFRRYQNIVFFKPLHLILVLIEQLASAFWEGRFGTQEKNIRPTQTHDIRTNLWQGTIPDLHLRF